MRSLPRILRATTLHGLSTPKISNWENPKYFLQCVCLAVKETLIVLFALSRMCKSFFSSNFLYTSIQMSHIPFNFLSSTKIQSQNLAFYPFANLPSRPLPRNKYIEIKALYIGWNSNFTCTRGDKNLFLFLFQETTSLSYVALCRLWFVKILLRHAQ